jgi:hypothetical protein
MSRRPLAFMLWALVLATVAAPAFQTPAPNLTGTWTGFLVSSTDPSNRDAAQFALKQSGTELTGTGGPNDSQQWVIRKGVVTTTKDGTTVTFEVQNDTLLLQFDLKLVDGHLKGGVTAERDGEKRTGTIDLERGK